MFILSTNSKNKLKGVHPDVVKVFEAAIEKSPYDFKITHGLRTTEEQNKLYKKGRTLPGSIVTYKDGYRRKSNHQAKSDGFGHAVDIVICGEIVEDKYVKYTTTKEMYDEKKLKAVAEHIKSVAKELGVAIEWGGDWTKFKDTPHFELA